MSKILPYLRRKDYSDRKSEVVMFDWMHPCPSELTLDERCLANLSI
jgi:hypothetical protein